jgi:hypothetical protein
MTDPVAELMNRVATACGRNEPAPDPTLIWLKAELARRDQRERKAARLQLLSHGLSSVAIAVSAWVALRFAAPALATVSPALLVTGVSLAAAFALVWFFGFRPLRHAL